MTATTAAPAPPVALAAAPHSIAAEQSVLGAVLLSDRCLPGLRMQEGLKPEHFYREKHATIYAAMCALSDRDVAIDVLTVAAELEQHGLLESVGGKAAVDLLTGGVPGLGGIRRYAQIVIEHWVARERMAAAYEQLAGILNHNSEAWEAGLQRAHTVIASGVDDGYLGKDRLADHMLAWLEESHDDGLPFPAELPRVGWMVRLRPGHVTVLAAWPSHGKTASALTIAAAAGFAAHRVVIWTNEDTAEELVAKHVNQATGIPASVISDRRTDDPRLPQIVAAIGRVPFEVQPCHGWTAAQVAAHVRRERPAIAVVDHFHNLAGIGLTSDTDEAIRVLAAAAGQSGSHLLLCAQLNRNRLSGVCKPPPVLADLRGSAMFEAAAHTMLLVHRDEEEAEDSVRGKLGYATRLDVGSVNCAKNKVTGRTGVVPVNWDATRLRFVESDGATSDEPVPGSADDFGF